jgi:hypothetical protein
VIEWFEKITCFEQLGGTFESYGIFLKLNLFFFKLLFESIGSSLPECWLRVERIAGTICSSYNSHVFVFSAPTVWISWFISLHVFVRYVLSCSATNHYYCHCHHHYYYYTTTIATTILLLLILLLYYYYYTTTILLLLLGLFLDYI